MIRRFRQWLAGAEIQAMARDLDALQDRFQDGAHRAEGLQLRLERLANRVNMRMNRAGIGTEDRDAEILRELREQAGSADDDWTRRPPGDWGTG